MMSTVSSRRSISRRGVAGMALRILIPLDTVALLFAGIVHLTGANIPLGIVTFIEPPILAAGIVETLGGLLFAWATYALWQAHTSAWAAAMTAHLFSIAGFVVGLLATRLGTTPFNATYHRVMLPVFVVGLVLLLLPSAQASARAEQPR